MACMDTKTSSKAPRTDSTPHSVVGYSIPIFAFYSIFFEDGAQQIYCDMLAEQLGKFSAEAPASRQGALAGRSEQISSRPDLKREIKLLSRLKSTHPNRSRQGKPPLSPCHPDRSSEGAQWRDLQFFHCNRSSVNSSHYFFPCPKENRKPTRNVNGSDGYPIWPILLLLVRLSSCV
jgi:hypothetical protein